MIVTERERGRYTVRGRSRLHAPGARRGIRSWVSRIAPRAKGRRQTAAPPRDPQLFLTMINVRNLLVIILLELADGYFKNQNNFPYSNVIGPFPF